MCGVRTPSNPKQPGEEGGPAIRSGRGSSWAPDKETRENKDPPAPGLRVPLHRPAHTPLQTHAHTRKRAHVRHTRMLFPLRVTHTRTRVRHTHTHVQVGQELTKYGKVLDVLIFEVTTPGYQEVRQGVGVVHSRTQSKQGEVGGR